MADSLQPAEVDLCIVVGETGVRRAAIAADKRQLPTLVIGHVVDEQWRAAHCQRVLSFLIVADVDRFRRRLLHGGLADPQRHAPCRAGNGRG